MLGTCWDILEGLKCNSNTTQTKFKRNSNAIQTIQKQKNIKKAVFLDPVDNSAMINNNVFNFLNNNDKMNIKYLESILILNAEKSYKGSVFPKLEIPFIPAFGLNIKKFEKKYPDLNIEKVSANDYGHSDILDSLWSDLMHVTLSKGNENRDQDTMNEYVNWLSEKIYNFINEDEDQLDEIGYLTSDYDNSDDLII